MAADLTITTPDDWHVHLRDDDMLSAVAGYSAALYARVLVMPNLVPAITTSAGAASYRDRIIDAVAKTANTVTANTVTSRTGKGNTEFAPQMAVYLTPELDAADLIAGHENGSVFGVKYYPAGATTNSDQGGTSIRSFDAILEVMAEHKIPLFVHAEAVDESLDIFDREAAFLERELAPVCEALPDLAITVEHLSTSQGVELVKSFANTHGSITPHHLSCDRSDLLANGMRPHLYCKPVINSRSNRDALRSAATSGSERFFLGTDSAPHPLATKEAEVARAGIFNAPYGLQVVAEVFFEEDRLDCLESFVSLNGAAHYGLDPNRGRVRLRRRSDDELVEEPASLLVTNDGNQVRLFGVQEAKRWAVSRL